MLWTLVMLAGAVQAEPRFGVGLVVGDPTGISLGWRGSAWSGAQAGVGLDGKRLDAHADYLQTLTVWEPPGRFQVPVYVGAGVGATTAEKGWFGERADVNIRVPVGASLLFDRVPVEIFAQAVPTVRVIPSTAFGLGLGVGGRYYF